MNIFDNPDSPELKDQDTAHDEWEWIVKGELDEEVESAAVKPKPPSPKKENRKYKVESEPEKVEIDSSFEDLSTAAGGIPLVENAASRHGLLHLRYGCCPQGESHFSSHIAYLLIRPRVSGFVTRLLGAGRDSMESNELGAEEHISI